MLLWCCPWVSVTVPLKEPGLATFTFVNSIAFENVMLLEQPLSCSKIVYVPSHTGAPVQAKLMRNSSPPVPCCAIPLMRTVSAKAGAAAQLKSPRENAAKRRLRETRRAPMAHSLRRHRGALDHDESNWIALQ